MRAALGGGGGATGPRRARGRGRGRRWRTTGGRAAAHPPPVARAPPANVRAVSASSPKRRFFAILGIILVVAAGVRIAYILGEAKNDEQFYDAAYYELQARAIANGHGYTDPFQYLPHAPHRAVPAA